jgi:uncharacterized protein (DUF58 family)
MNFGSRGITKAAYANTLAATLAFFLHQQGDAIGVMTFDERIREYLPARHRPGHLRHLMLALEKPAGGAATDLVAPLKRIAEIVRKRGLMVLLSDLLAPVEALERNLATLTATGHEVVVFQVLDPAEVSFDFTKAALFHDLESGRQLYVDPESIRAEYQRRFGAHCRAIEATCAKLGVTHHRLTTDRPMELALFDFLRERMNRGKVIKRNAA